MIPSSAIRISSSKSRGVCDVILENKLLPQFSVFPQKTNSIFPEGGKEKFGNCKHAKSGEYEARRRLAPALF